MQLIRDRTIDASACHRRIYKPWPGDDGFKFPVFCLRQPERDIGLRLTRQARNCAALAGDLDERLPGRMQRILLELCKCRVQHSDVVVPVVRIVQRYCNQPPSAAFRGRHQAAPALFGKPGLDADGIRIQPKQFVMVGHGTAFHGIGRCADNLAEVCIFHGISGQFCEFTRSCVMVFAVKPVRIVKMRIGKAEFQSFIVHGGDERLLSAAFACNGERGVVAAHQHEPI